MVTSCGFPLAGSHRKPAPKAPPIGWSNRKQVDKEVLGTASAAPVGHRSERGRVVGGSAPSGVGRLAAAL